MKMLDSQQGIILLEKKIEQDHKLAATELNISVLSGNDFEKYARCTSRDYDMVSSATCVIESWDQYYGIHKMFPKLKSAIEFVKFGFWNKRDYRLQLRHTLSVIRDIRHEVNPDHPIHLTLVSDLISLFSVALSEVVANVFNQYLLPETKKQLSDELKVLIWGGRESYTFINSLYSRIGNGGGYENEPTLSLPEWDMFIQLVRQCLESPYDICKVPMILREIAFEYIAPQPYEWAKVLASENLQAAKFSLLIAEYVCRSSKIPPEFLQQLSKRIIQIQA
ncbi:hypothetical protein JJB07_09660 [Tumebacillus sp. ITR2]|uniref:DUF403 domain-containing protein n=2 Tax=Tumebacillus amylolyticus TaxID=2801339 RepID=A0ABS1J9G4_9BACL|nr:hypothetical protein [Tumebacillus amylolyticus]